MKDILIGKADMRPRRFGKSLLVSTSFEIF